MIKVNIQDAKTHLSNYVARAEQGEVVVVCRHNQPVAELRAIHKTQAPQPRTAGLLKGLVSWDADAFNPMTDEELAQFDGSPLFTGRSA